MMLFMDQKGKLIKRTNDAFYGLKKYETYINSKKKLKLKNKIVYLKTQEPIFKLL